MPTRDHAPPGRLTPSGVVPFGPVSRTRAPMQLARITLCVTRPCRESRMNMPNAHPFSRLCATYAFALSVSPTYRPASPPLPSSVLWVKTMPVDSNAAAPYSPCLSPV